MAKRSRPKTPEQRQKAPIERLIEALLAAEAELKAATGLVGANAAAKKLTRVKAELKRHQNETLAEYFGYR